ncbi:MAG TPA: endo alpha-1,4 polygalactosaminidase [Devosia sp.]|nr:endo alpha-1,4 polygalactosaminidase [Devosia sp.]
MGSAQAAPAWVPALEDNWQWQLTGDLNTGYDVDVYDIDLFDTPRETIDALHAAGRRVVCYFSAGSAENWREDFSRFAEADKGNPLEDWEGERWLDTGSRNVRAIMQDRLKLAADKGCDGVEPDNLDGYQNENGLSLTPQSARDFEHFLAAAAHDLGLAIGLKNDTDNVAVMAETFDFAVNEECFQYEECDVYAAFTGLGKPVFTAEYEDRFLENTDGARDALCAASRAMKLHTLVLAWDLDDSVRFSCDETGAR